MKKMQTLLQKLHGRSLIASFLVMTMCGLLTVGVCAAVSGSDSVIYTTKGGEWVQVDENTFTMDVDGDGKVDIQLLKDKDEWSYIFDVADPDAEYYAWEDTIPEGYEIDESNNDVHYGYRSDGTYGPYIIISKSSNSKIINKSTEQLPTYGGLKLTKKVSGSGADTSQNFRFNISLTTEEQSLQKFLTGNQSFGDVNFTDGIGIAYLKHNEFVTISDVPAGVHWSIQEVAADGYATTWTGGTTSKNGVTGTIKENTTTAVVCTNNNIDGGTTVNPETGKLIVTKTVENGDKDDSFNFTAVFNGLNPNTEHNMYDELFEQTKYSHTSNIRDDGTATQNSYGNNVNFNEVVSIPGVKSLHVKITYQTESTSYDWACMWQGSHDTYTAANNYGSSLTKKLGGTTKTTKEYDVDGDTVTFGFKSDGSVCNYYGFYAVVTSRSGNKIASFTSQPNGMAVVDFSLQDGKQAIFDKLPVGCQYHISEAESDYTASYEIKNATNVVMQKGENFQNNQILSTQKETLDENEAATVAFTNAKPAPSSEIMDIPVEKVWVDGDNAAGLRPESITVRLLQDEDVIATATLDEGTGWKTQFSDLPIYQSDGKTAYKYSLQEVEVPEYETQVVKNEDGSYTITNTSRFSCPLSVTKKVSGSFGDKTKDFDFALALSDIESMPTSLTYKKGDESGTMELDANGIVNFTLSHGETIIFEDVPVGASYSVTEQEAEGYTTSIQKGSGKMPDKGIAVTVTNIKKGTVPTSADTNTRTIIAIVVFTAIGLCCFEYHRRRNKMKKK